MSKKLLLIPKFFMTILKVFDLAIPFLIIDSDLSSTLLLSLQITSTLLLSLQIYKHFISKKSNQYDNFLLRYRNTIKYSPCILVKRRISINNLKK